MKRSQIIDGEKQCAHCSLWKKVECFGKETRAFTGYRDACRKCRSVYLQEYYLDDVKHERKRISARRYYHKNIIQSRIRSKGLYRKHVENRKVKKRLGVQKLSDSYIRDLLSRNSFLRGTDIPYNLIETQREYLKLWRLVRCKVLS